MANSIFLPPGAANFTAAKVKAIKTARAVKRHVGRNKLKYGGVAALAALGAGPGKLIAERVMGVDDETLQRKALQDFMASQAEAEQRRLIQRAQGNSIQQGIDMNLMRLQQSAPDIFAAVAAGRKLPQGAVVIGGERRQDLLNELGRAMSEGRFSR